MNRTQRTDAATAIAAGRARRQRRRATATVIILVVTALVFAASLMLGRTLYEPAEVWAVLTGQTVPGASFTVGELRLPRAVLGILAGFAFGASGTTFQTLLRNPLASPDVIGISAGAGASAVVAIIVLGLNDTAVSVTALLGALATAGIITLLSYRNGFAGIRFILIGIGIAAMLTSVTSYILSRAANWDIQAAMQWLAGSLNGASWERVLPLAIACGILIPLLLLCSRGLSALRLGDDAARALGVPVHLTRVTLILAAVALLAFATAGTGPIAFVAFMAGPIAARLVGPGGSLLLPAGCIGALLVLASDLAGQFLFDERYPVGVITGVLGAPYLILLLIRMNRTGSSI
ncbi:iron chelate uptake ABC transporter family permease subunit [Leucobacter rhizosphaerae]|uniref:Iron chelate uptake ABC transporter family permease subunit n=1 Tax=Leucobacter rhizosphaerae TaxID=2932245 RepID=A0ABY4G0K5_9MICO|nr:iron chelate uptake ABC transporter family permease subunit [Leucobacter rhizosphaerae]UOQ61844.1 iron chelate uptake ABC transporter family permease subunit [Leucobacter rhizosphaerae]